MVSMRAPDSQTPLGNGHLGVVKYPVLPPSSGSGQTDPRVVRVSPPDAVLYNVARRLSATPKRCKYSPAGSLSRIVLRPVFATTPACHIH